MAIPEGYTKLGLVGYSDKGEYSAAATYNKYNVVLHEGSTYVALKDGLSGVTPSNDGENWRYFARGFEAEMASEITAVDKYNITGDTPDPTGASTTEVMLQLLLDKYGDQIINKLVSNEGFQAKLMNYIINNGAANQPGFALDARQGNPNEEGSMAAQINQLNSGSSGQLGNNIYWSKIGKLVLVTCGSYTFSIEAWENQNICPLPFPIYGHAVYYSATLAQNKESPLENNLRVIAEDGYLKINAWGSQGYDNASIAFSLLYIANE